VKLKDLHLGNNEVSAKSISASVISNITAIEILRGKLLKEHMTKSPAVLLCILGAVEYEDETGQKIVLNSGDFHHIAPMIKHWVKGLEDSELILVK